MCSERWRMRAEGDCSTCKLHANNGQTLGDLCQNMKMSRQAVAKHLAILEEANLVSTQWRGREKLHFKSIPSRSTAQPSAGSASSRRLAWTPSRTSNAGLKEKTVADEVEAASSIVTLHSNHTG